MFPSDLCGRQLLNSWRRFYSLVETTKATGLDPFDYLKKVFEKFPKAETDVEYLEV
jgi:hypothetical protein